MPHKKHQNSPPSKDHFHGVIENLRFPDPPGGEIFEFVWDVTGGDLAGYYGSDAYTPLLAVDSNFDGVFDETFSNSEGGFSDTYADVIPEPSSATLLLMYIVGSLSALTWRRLRRIRRAL